MEPIYQEKAPPVQSVYSADSPEFSLLSWALTRSIVIGLDAEWKPILSHQFQSNFPAVSLLQIACLLTPENESTRLKSDDSIVFLLDLQAIQLPSIYELLRKVFASPDIIKLGFRFKQDLVYLSSTFCSQDCNPGFDRVEPFIDITSIYNYLQQPKQLGRKVPKQTKSLAAICKEVLGISLSKELQCSDWSQRPLTKEQKMYAAADAYCLLDIFKVFQAKIVREGHSSRNSSKNWSSNSDSGLKQIFETPDSCNLVTRTGLCEASDMIHVNIPELHSTIQTDAKLDSMKSCEVTKQVDEALLWIIRKYGDRILLKDSDRKPKTSKKKVKKSSAGLMCKEKRPEITDEWRGPPPWDPALGGDGSPKFLCDVMFHLPS